MGAIILRPKHISALWLDEGGLILHKNRTAAAYRRQLETYLQRDPAKSDPIEVTTPTEAYIGAGAWRIVCPCGERTHADPDWHLSCCFGCGRVYTNVIFPAESLAIETLLAKRRDQGTRNWQLPETLDDLVAEQIAHGEPV